MTAVEPVSISSPAEGLRFNILGENFYQVSSMMLKATVEVDGQIVDELNENCNIVSNENAVLILGDISDTLTFRAKLVTAEIDGKSIELWSNE